MLSYELGLIQGFIFGIVAFIAGVCIGGEGEEGE